MLPVETVKEIAEMARDSMRPTSTAHGLGQLLIFKDKEMKYVDGAVPPALRRLLTFDAFTALVADRVTHRVEAEGIEGDGPLYQPTAISHEGSVVYYSAAEFTYIESPGSLYGFRAVFTPVQSAQWQWLCAESSKWLDQAAFVRVLRITLRDCLPSPALLAIIREVKFNTQQGAAGVVQHARQSMGRDIVEEVKGTGAIPEEVTLKMKPFENLVFEAHVQCAVEIDVATCTFKLTPFPGELRKCLDKVLDLADDMLPDVPTYYGAAK